jgi:hypothetical protein
MTWRCAKKMVEQLVIEESKHEAVEEMYFWPAVREMLPGGDKLGGTAIGREQEGKEVLDKLDKLDVSEPGSRSWPPSSSMPAARTSVTRRHGSGGCCGVCCLPRRPARSAPRSSKASKRPRPARTRTPRRHQGC